MTACVERPYKSAAVCQAAGLRRATFDAWLLRRLLPLPPGPGTGRERRFSANEAILIAVATELTKLNLSIGVVAHAMGFLNRDPDGFLPRAQHEDGWLLILAPSSAPAGVDAPSLMPAALFRPKTNEPESLADLERAIREQLGDPPSTVRVKVSVIARRTLERLAMIEDR